VKPFLSGMGSYGGSQSQRHHPPPLYDTVEVATDKRQFSQASHLDQRKHLCLWEMWRFVFPIPDIKRTSLIVADQPVETVPVEIQEVGCCISGAESRALNFSRMS
jgi:hypothetical protein